MKPGEIGWAFMSREEGEPRRGFDLKSALWPQKMMEAAWRMGSVHNQDLADKIREIGSGLEAVFMEV